MKRFLKELAAAMGGEVATESGSLKFSTSTNFSWQYWDGRGESGDLALKIRDLLQAAAQNCPSEPSNKHLVRKDLIAPRMEVLHWLNTPVSAFTTKGAAEALIKAHKSGLISSSPLSVHSEDHD